MIRAAIAAALMLVSVPAVAKPDTRLQAGGQAIPVSFASGNGGNKIYVAPTRRLVVAITSGAYGKGHGQRRSQAILQALLAADITR